MTDTAVITGGTGGMGTATARIMGGDHRIVVADLHQDRIDEVCRELSGRGIDCIGAVCDITDRASVERLLDTAGSGGHHVRAVVHTAGVSPQMTSAEQIAKINGTGTVNVARAFLPRVSEGDVLVNVASIAGHSALKYVAPTRAFHRAETDPHGFERALARRGRIAGRKLHSGATYAISKAFVIWYTQYLAGAFGQHGARVVSVSPGTFDTAMGQLEKDHGASDFMKVSAIKRFGTPEEISSVLAFCASRGPGYLTGTDVLVDGGTKAGERFN